MSKRSEKKRDNVLKHNGRAAANGPGRDGLHRCEGRGSGRGSNDRVQMRLERGQLVWLKMPGVAKGRGAGVAQNNSLLVLDCSKGDHMQGGQMSVREGGDPRRSSDEEGRREGNTEFGSKQ